MAADRHTLSQALQKQHHHRLRASQQPRHVNRPASCQSSVDSRTASRRRGPHKYQSQAYQNYQQQQLQKQQQQQKQQLLQNYLHHH
ncbi:hypothetical protein VYU27_008850 [Nannochloropsis oceanica]